MHATHRAPSSPCLQTDNNINELMERVSIGGSKVVQGAGKAVKLLGKLARGLGGSAPAPAADAPKPSANRAPSSSSLAGAGSVPGPLTGAWRGAARQLLARALAPVWGRPGQGQAPACLPTPCCSTACLPPWRGACRACPAAADDEAGYPHVSGMVGEIVTLVAPPGGGVWVAHKCGIVDRYTAAGQRLGSTDCGPAITAASCVGQRVWVGFADGMIRRAGSRGGLARAGTAVQLGVAAGWGRVPAATCLLLVSTLPLRAPPTPPAPACSVRDQEGGALRVFQAHAAAILSITQAGSRTYSLAADGSIKGWSSAVPHDADAHAL